MDRARKKLIEELIRVGRLIGPAPSTGQRKGENATELPGITQQSGMNARSPVADLEGLPIVDDVVDQPYTTKDMFADTSGSSNAHKNERVEPIAPEREKQFSQEATATRFPVEELARELVTLIEDRVSQRSGEQLDDTFRDELTQAVTAQLEGWLKYD